MTVRMTEGKQTGAMSMEPHYMARDTLSSVGAAEFREAMSLLGTAVNVITTSGPAGRTGLTATAVCPVSDDPAALLFCVNRRSTSVPIFMENGVACVNTLRAHDSHIADMFAGRSQIFGSDRFNLGDWTASSNGCPALSSALITFECRIMDMKTVATHIVVFAGVTAVVLGSPGQALVYHGRTYKAL